MRCWRSPVMSVKNFILLASHPCARHSPASQTPLLLITHHLTSRRHGSFCGASDQWMQGNGSKYMQLTWGRRRRNKFLASPMRFYDLFYLVSTRRSWSSVEFTSDSESDLICAITGDYVPVQKKQEIMLADLAHRHVGSGHDTCCDGILHRLGVRWSWSWVRWSWSSVERPVISSWSWLDAMILNPKVWS
jgi:hypothetical protein